MAPIEHRTTRDQGRQIARRCDVRPLCRLDGRGACAKWSLALLLSLLGAGTSLAQDLSAGVPLHHGNMPPGVIGQAALVRPEPLAGYFQPVSVQLPDGAEVAFAEAGTFAPSQSVPAVAGMAIGQVYRLRVTGIARHPGQEVFPSIELIDRLYAPAGQEARFPVVVQITQDDLELALAGKYVMRVVYVEDPRTALPVTNERGDQAWFDVAPGRDPLRTADELGRPIAIVRMGGLLPNSTTGPDMTFLFGCPPLVRYAQPGETLTPQPQLAPVTAGTGAASLFPRR